MSSFDTHSFADAELPFYSPRELNVCALPWFLPLFSSISGMSGLSRTAPVLTFARYTLRAFVLNDTIKRLAGRFKGKFQRTEPTASVVKPFRKERRAAIFFCFLHQSLEWYKPWDCR